MLGVVGKDQARQFQRTSECQASEGCEARPPSKRSPPWKLASVPFAPKYGRVSKSGRTLGVGTSLVGLDASLNLGRDARHCDCGRHA
jgi:hypothetical protein